MRYVVLIPMSRILALTDVCQAKDGANSSCLIEMITDILLVCKLPQQNLQGITLDCNVLFVSRLLGQMYPAAMCTHAIQILSALCYQQDSLDKIIGMSITGCPAINA